MAAFDIEFPSLTDQDEKKLFAEEVPEIIGILPLKNTILYPGMILPITVGRDKSIQLVKEVQGKPDRVIGVITQRNMDVEDPDPTDLHTIGTVARILRTVKMPDGHLGIVIQGRSRFQVEEFLEESPYFRARVNKLPEVYPSRKETEALKRNLKQVSSRIIDISSNLPDEAATVLNNIEPLSFLIYFLSSNLRIDAAERQAILENPFLLRKGELVLEYLSKEYSIVELTEQIQSRVRTDMDKQQREFFLRQKMRAIQEELGEGGSGETDLEALQRRAKLKKWPPKVQEIFDKESAKLRRLNPSMPDYGVIMNYLDWLLELPWQAYSTDTFDFKRTRKILDDDHYGLETVKERILEYLAVLKLKGNRKAPILCFYGPPGVGKTSLGKSIAASLGREFVRISLGGVRDEAEIRGHRRTYIGALPGRIIQGLKRAKTGNPVFMLDELDKVGNDFRGDPASALLEVLDPEQNSTFQDHFLEVEYDLSSVMFIATANTLNTIHPALRDRLEIIEINGYSQEEKLQIAKQHLVPRARLDHGLKGAQVKLGDKVLQRIIDGYTRESGVRQLSQQLAKIHRVAAKRIVVDGESTVSVTDSKLQDFLGIPRHENDMYQRADVPGVSIGLAWTPVGGDILFIETSLSRGTGKLSLTGQLGDVMKESATLAHHYLKAHAQRIGIDHRVFNHWDIHLHFPAGATPKDGPSAGTAILSAMASAYTQRLVTANLAMTGEITLRGKVLPVGGIKEKLLAARRAGIKKVLLPIDNKKDVSEIKAEHLQGMDVHYVTRMDEVLALALEKPTVKGALDLMEPIRESAKHTTLLKDSGSADAAVVH